MSKLYTVVLIAATQVSALPAGVTAAGGFRFQLASPAPGVNLMSADVTSTSASFADVPEGSYTGTCQRLDTSGNLFGAVAQISVSVTSAPPPPPATFDEPATLSATVTLQPDAAPAPAVATS